MAERAQDERMTVDQFIDWASAQERGRFELLDGEIVAMSPERVSHNETKQLVWLALREALRSRGLPCKTYGDGLTDPIDDTTSFEPDALVRCGDPLDPEATTVPDPLIVVEVISPGSRGIDTNLKLQAYFSLASVAHYLVLDPRRRALIHYRRDADDAPSVRICHDGTLVLDPPGIELDIASCFPEPESGPKPE
jgi:Uma2 family endonuclease